MDHNGPQRITKDHKGSCAPQRWASSTPATTCIWTVLGCVSTQPYAQCGPDHGAGVTMDRCANPTMLSTDLNTTLAANPTMLAANPSMLSG